MEYIKAITKFNNVSSFKICVPSVFVLDRLKLYTSQVYDLTKDAVRYESLLKEGHVDDRLSTEIGLFVLHLNQLTKGVKTDTHPTSLHFPENAA